MSDAPLWVLFGGSGFIGMHLAEHVLASVPGARVLIADLAEPMPALRGEWYASAQTQGRLRWLRVDVREPITDASLAGASVAVNLAAVHREPGHEPHEYFVTNVRGAEHVADWAARSGTQRLVFTSSISVYGNTRGGVDERSLPMPETPYGISKLIAEQVFRRWRAADAARRLAIVRPAVVFGPCEGGNVSRLVRAVARGRFVFMDNRDVRKSGGYVRELCAVITWMVARMDGQPEALANFALPDVPSLAGYVSAIQSATGRARWIPNLPFRLVHLLARVIAAIPLLGARSPVHPRRVEKLVWATDVRPAYLVEQRFPFAFTLEQACADWRRRQPQEWS